MTKPISELKGCEQEQDIYVLASGKSLDFIPPAFFAGKVTIGVGDLYATPYACKYCVMKEYNSLANALKYNHILCVSEYDCGNQTSRKNNIPGDYYIFPHKRNDALVHPEELDSDRIIVSWTTMTSAIHLAYYFGAKNIIIAGHDCGDIDGQSNIDNYWQCCPMGKPDPAWYRSWLGQISAASELLAHHIRERGVPVVSINPWINFQLEGQSYETIR